MFSDFRVLDFWPIFLLFCFWFCSPTKNYPPNFCHAFRVAKKQGKTRVFVELCRVFSILFAIYIYIYFFISSMWCPYARVSLRVPSSLQMSDSSLLSYLCLLFSFCFPLCSLDLFTLITSMVLYQ